MPNLIFRILLRIARKLAIKELEAFIVELAIKYTKGKFEYLLNPPQVPDIEEFPGIVVSNKEGEEDNDIKKAVIAAGAGLGTGILLATQVGDKVSDSDIKSGIDDLNGATEDWNEGSLLATLAIMGKDSLSSIADSINEKDFEFNLPDFEFTPLPPYQRIFLDEKTERIITRPQEGVTDEYVSTPAGPTTQIRRRQIFGYGRRVVPRKGHKMTDQEYAIYHEQFYTREYLNKYYIVSQPGQQLDFLGPYQYDSARQSIGENGRMRAIKQIVVHCTSDYPSSKRDMEYYRRLFVQGRSEEGYSDVGYHYIIFQDGRIESGRPLSKIGAHCPECNRTSIGISYVGGMVAENTYEDTRTDAQVKSLWNLIFYLLKYFPSAKLYGHHDFNPTKACPCFNVREEYNSILNGTYGKSEVIASSHSESSSQTIDDTQTQWNERHVIKTNGA